MNKKEINEMKKEVKKVTGLKMKDIEITSCYQDRIIGYKYFASDYDRATNNYTHKTIEIQ